MSQVTEPTGRKKRKKEQQQEETKKATKKMALENQTSCNITEGKRAKMASAAAFTAWKMGREKWRKGRK